MYLDWLHLGMLKSETDGQVIWKSVKEIWKLAQSHMKEYLLDWKLKKKMGLLIGLEGKWEYNRRLVP